MSGAATSDRPVTAPLRLVGSLARGLGQGARFVAIGWVSDGLAARFGFVPWPGTLNLHLAPEQADRVRARLDAAPAVSLPPPAGAHCGARCFAVEVAGRVPGVLLLPDVPDYPADKLEVVAAVALRPLLGLRDGDSVELCLV